MAETWSPPHTWVGGPGIMGLLNKGWSSDNTFGGLLAGKINKDAPVKNHQSMVKDGWTLTGYKTVTMRNGGYGKSGGMTRTLEIPIYTKLPSATSSTPEKKPDAGTDPAKPIDLKNPTSDTTNETSDSTTANPPVQDFKLDEQAEAQKSYLDDALTKRMEKFQNLLNSLSL